MTTTRDWRNDWAQGAYGGARFWVEKKKRSGGRRLVVHQFPKRDTPYVEDLGEDAHNLSLTVYVASDAADAEARALEAACNARGPQFLDLPFFRGLAQCNKCDRDDDSSKQGYIAFSVTWVEDNLLGGAPLPVPFLAELVHRAASALRGPLATLLQTGFGGLGVPSFVVDHAVGMVRQTGGHIDLVLEGFALNQSLAPTIARGVRRLVNDAPVLAAIGPDAAPIEARAARRAGRDSPPALVVDLLADVLDTARRAMSPVDATAFGLEVATLTFPADGRPRRSRFAAVEARNALMMEVVVQTLGAAAAAVAIADTEFVDRRAVIAARGVIAETLSAVIDRASGLDDRDVVAGLDDVRGKVVDLLSRTVADLSPVVTVEAPRSMPSLYWSNRLYATAADASELADRNGVLHPGLMPRQFSARISGG